jgi:acetyltransferase-like isoleucine patch superfamily enzyme
MASKHVEIDPGSIVGAHAVLTSQVSVGRNAVIGAGAIASHDCRLEDFVTLAPGHRVLRQALERLVEAFGRIGAADPARTGPAES